MKNTNTNQLADRDLLGLHVIKIHVGQLIHAFLICMKYHLMSLNRNISKTLRDCTMTMSECRKHLISPTPSKLGSANRLVLFSKLYHEQFAFYGIFTPLHFFRHRGVWDISRNLGTIRARSSIYISFDGELSIQWGRKLSDLVYLLRLKSYSRLKKGNEGGHLNARG